jgi:hypothetical protein
MSGKLKTKGNMMLALKLDGVLKVGYDRYKLSPPFGGEIDGGDSPTILF